jgi:hypothetical protein
MIQERRLIPAPSMAETGRSAVSQDVAAELSEAKLELAAG